MKWRMLQPRCARPVSRPPKKSVVRYHDFMYQAASWDRARRVVAKVEWHQGELFPRAGYVVTNLTGWSKQGQNRPFRLSRVSRLATMASSVLLTGKCRL